MIQVKTVPVPALARKYSVLTTEGHDSLKTKFKTVGGTELERFTFRHRAESISASLRALAEINCAGSVNVTIAEGCYSSEGTLEVWFEGTRLLAEQVVAEVETHAQFIAKQCIGSRAEFMFTLKQQIVGYR